MMQSMRARRFPQDVLSALRETKTLRIRPGRARRRFIGIRMVVVDGCVCSWSLKPRSWYRTFLDEPAETIQIANRELPIRAVHTRSEPTKAAVDRAYLKKYGLPGGYSVRNAFMGSIEAAFRAGTPVATSAAIPSTAVTPAKVAGSVGFTA